MQLTSVYSSCYRTNPSLHHQVDRSSVVLGRVKILRPGLRRSLFLEKRKEKPITMIRNSCYIYRVLLLSLLILPITIITIVTVKCHYDYYCDYYY